MIAPAFRLVRPKCTATPSLRGARKASIRFITNKLTPWLCPCHTCPAENTRRQLTTGKPGPAAQIDIAPSDLAELNLPIPDRRQDAPLNEIARRQFVFFGHMDEFELIDFSEPSEHWKYWLDRNSGQEHAFELLTDPGETNNRVASISPAKKAMWREKLKPSLTSEPLR